MELLPSAAHCRTQQLEYSTIVKTTNYLASCINASEAKKAGGYLGIMVDKDDNVLVIKIYKI